MKLCFFFSCERNYKHNNIRIQMLLEFSFLEFKIKISQHLCEHFYHYNHNILNFKITQTIKLF